MFFNKVNQKPFSIKLNENIKLFSEGKLSYLAPIFCVLSETDDNAKLTAANFLLELINNVPYKKIAQFAENIRGFYNTNIWSKDWSKVAMKDLFTATMSEDEKKAVTIFASFHANGYIREKAINELTKYPNTLKYILLRRNDWVRQVRDAAKNAVEYRFNHLTNGELIEAIPAIEKLIKGGRDDFSFTYEIFIAAFRKNAKELDEGLKSKDQQIRLFCARLLLKSDDRQNRLAQYLIKEKLPHNRAVIYSEYIKTASDVPKKLVNQMLSDRYAKVRVMALDFICILDAEKSFDIALDFLLDTNVFVRATARFLIKQKSPDFSFRDFYLGKLKINSQTSITGLGETGRKEDAGFLESYLTHSSNKIICITMKALIALDKEKYLLKIVSFLDNNSIAIVKEAANLLSGHAQPYAQKIKDIFNSSIIQYNRIKCAKLLFSVSKWDALIYMLEATDDNDFIISDLAKDAIEKWIKRFNRSFILPAVIQKENIINKIANLKRKDIPTKSLLYYLS